MLSAVVGVDKGLIIVISSAGLALKNDNVGDPTCSKFIIFPSFKLILVVVGPSAVVPELTLCLIYAVEPAPVNPLPSPYNPPVAVRTPTLIF